MCADCMRRLAANGLKVAFVDGLGEDLLVAEAALLVVDLGINHDELSESISWAIAETAWLASA